MSKFFADTYALLEIIKGNKNYEKFVNKKISTSILNLYELYYIILRDFGGGKAMRYFRDFNSLRIEFNDKDIFDAASFKLKNKKRRLSYADCLGYAISRNRDMKFLTGDKEFSNFKKVEFVK